MKISRLVLRMRTVSEKKNLEKSKDKICVQ